MNIKALLSELTLEEKIALLQGTDAMFTNPVPRLDIPMVSLADGPHGLRRQTTSDYGTVADASPATAFPTASLVASGFNPENSYKIGVAIAEEMNHYGVDVLLGPGVNIHRSPLCGRNFEYYSEDPYLAGKMGVGQVMGVQSQGCGVSVKHFALNNSENFRFMSDSVVDERAMREIYLKPFEMIVKEAKPHTVMCAYNKVNGTFASENKLLLNDILRGEWGFDGLVMSDWGATHDRVLGVKSGLDLEMPGDTSVCRKWILDAVESGELTMDEVDLAVSRVLALRARYEGKTPGADPKFDEHNELAARIAEDSAVLLRNERGTLPVKSGERVAVIGEMFDKMRYQGSGSSMINSTKVTTPKMAFDAAGVEYTYARGYKTSDDKSDDALVSEALSAAAGADKVLFFIGLTDRDESEGMDRAHMRLAANQLDLIKRLLDVGRRVAVIIFGGSPVELPFRDRVDSILMMYLPGQNGGTAVYNLLYGNVSPSGKLAETFPISYSDYPMEKEWSMGHNEIYRESIFVGYRYYNTKGVPVAYPFGFGLSYTTFEYSDYKVEVRGDSINVSLKILNTGSCYGGEIVQIYSEKPTSAVFRPVRELRAFEKVYLAPGESKNVNITLQIADLAYYDVKEKRYVVEDGEYVIRAAESSLSEGLSASVTLRGERIASPYSESVMSAYTALDISAIGDDLFTEMSGCTISPAPKGRPITVNSQLTDLKQTFLGRAIFGFITSIATSKLKEAKKLPPGPERDNRIKSAEFLYFMFATNTLNCMSMASAEALPYNLAEGLALIADNHPIKGIKRIMTPINAPKLPKDGAKKE